MRRGRRWSSRSFVAAVACATLASTAACRHRAPEWPDPTPCITPAELAHATVPVDPLSREIVDKLADVPIREIYDELMRERGVPLDPVLADLWRETHACVPETLWILVRFRGDSTPIADMVTSGRFTYGGPFSFPANPTNVFRDGGGMFLTSRLADLLSLPEVVEVYAEGLRDGEPISSGSALELGPEQMTSAPAQ